MRRSILMAFCLPLLSLSLGAGEVDDKLDSYLACQEEGTMARMVCSNRLTKWSLEDSRRYVRILDRVDEKFETSPEGFLKLLIALRTEREQFLSKLPREKRKAYPEIEERFAFLPHTVDDLWRKGWRSTMVFESVELGASGGTWLASYLAMERAFRNVGLKKIWGLKKFAVLGSLAFAMALSPAFDEVGSGGMRERRERKLEEGLLRLEQEGGGVGLRGQLTLLKKTIEDMVGLVSFYDDIRLVEDTIHGTIQRIEGVGIEGTQMYLGSLRQYVRDRNMLLESVGELE